MFIVSLATADLTVGLVVMPVSAVYIFAVDWPFGLVVCQFWLAVDYTASTASILNLLVLSVDRYRSVTDPLRYLRRRTSRHATTLIGVAWSLSALWVLPIVSWHWLFTGGKRSVAPRVCDTEYAHNATLKIGTALVNYYVPLTVMAVLYGRIFVAIRRRSKLEIWQNAVVVAGGEHNTSSLHRMAERVRRRRLLSSDDEERNEERRTEVIGSCSDNKKRTAGRFDGETSSKVQPTRVGGGNILQIQKTANVCDDEFEGASTGINTDECNTPTLMSGERHKSPLIDSDRKCVRFLLVTHQQSDSNEDELDHIEMWPVPPTGRGSELASDDRSSDTCVPTSSRLLRRLRDRTPTARHSRRDHSSCSSQKANSLSSEMKAAKQLGVIMSAFCVCFLPYFVCFVVVAFCPQCVDDRLMTVVTWIGYVNSTLNPFLYPLCNRQFRISFRRMFSEARRCGTDVKRSAVSL